MSSIDVSSRKFSRKFVTETHNKRSEFIHFTPHEKLTLQNTLQDHFDKLKILNSKIQSQKFEALSEEEFEDELTKCEEYNYKIRECLALLTVATTPAVPPLDCTVKSLLKSPVIPLPTFKSKEDEDLGKFFVEFEQTINRFNYSDYDKLLLLKQQVSGRALSLIKSLDAENQGYIQAKKLLEEALCSRDCQAFAVIKQMSQIKLKPEDDPYEYRSRMCNLASLVSKLKLDAHSFMQYFFWTGLNDSFRAELINITNNTRPSLEQILDNYFSACDRYCEKGKHDCKKKVTEAAETASLAVKVNYDKNPKPSPSCSLCIKAGKDAKHFIYKCVNFPSNVDKLKLISEFSGCANCGNFNHVTGNCRFKFKSRCGKCKKWHMTFLCPSSELAPKNAKEPFESKTNNSDQSKTTSKVQSKNDKKQTNENLGVTEMLKIDVDGDSILPTFSCCVKGKRVRGLKDSGCQSNLIDEQLAKDLGLRIVKEPVELTINGINAPKNYVTKEVELEVTFGFETQVIHAYCIPSLNITLSLPGLCDIVNVFKQKGYNLADSELSGEGIFDIKFILGIKSSYCIPETDCLFGKDQKSVYSSTHLGVVLKGSVKRLLEDTDFLEPQHYNELANVVVNCSSGEFPSAFKVLDSKGEVVESELLRATNDVLEKNYANFIEDSYNLENEVDSLNDMLVAYSLDNAERTVDGRLRMGLFWNARVSHLLGRNFNLSHKILHTLYKRLKNDHERLMLMNDNFKTQESLGIIEKIEDVDGFLETHPACSFLPFMGVFKMERQTTKCRVVYLSNLCEPNKNLSLTVSHNQAIHPGPSLNQKLSSAILHLRFGKYLFCFDIQKAFSMIELPEVDQERLLFLWFRNVEKGDLSVVAYKNLRLSFGLRCSPAILLLALYKILVIDTEGVSEDLIEFKKLLYQLVYMDNCAFTSESLEYLKWGYSMIDKIFQPYGFNLQQHNTNNISLQEEINITLDEPVPEFTKLLGIQWNRIEDTLSTKPISLNGDADSKRTVLSSVASQFNIFNFNGPLMNRSRLFVHRLQSQSDLGWDDRLSDSQRREWRNIVSQVNSAPPLLIDKNFGSREDKYNIVAFADSSRLLYGCVVYVHNLTCNRVSFVNARSKVIGKKLEDKSIPSLQLQAVSLAVETVMDIFKDVAGSFCLCPVKVKSLIVYSDSLVVIHWLNSFVNKLDKMQKCSVFVNNRLNHIARLCETKPVEFTFVTGTHNPADFITRPISYKLLIRSNYIKGPEFLTGNGSSIMSRDALSVRVPNPKVVSDQSDFNLISVNLPTKISDTLPFDLQKFSSLSKLVSIYANVLKFVNILKLRLKEKSSNLYDHVNVRPIDHNFYVEALKLIIRFDQHAHFPDIFSYFNSKNCSLGSIPKLVNQLNVYVDQTGLLRVKNKCERLKKLKRYHDYEFPILLSKDSDLVPLLIRDIHLKTSHGGVYSVLTEMRKQFWVPKLFSLVKRQVKHCLGCKRFRARPIKINQSCYREERLDASNVPFKNVYLDHMGPFYVKKENQKVKVWVLVITCMWSRAINMKVCDNLTTSEFLRCFQLHCFEFGLPEFCCSDMGSQLKVGSSVLKSFLHDPETLEYFNQHNVKPFRFEHYYTGRNELGGIVEVCVKLTKKLIFSSIGKNVLSYKDFEFLICKTVHLVNRRPVAFKDSLRDTTGDTVPEPITPEVLIHGTSLISVNLLPSLQEVNDPNWNLDVPGKIVNASQQLEGVPRVEHQYRFTET